MCKSFTRVRQRNPNIKLIYNDFSMESSNGWQKYKSDKVFNEIKGMKDHGCPIDGVGF
jgi:GH35 family endo-1,4-beta-xylanase